MYKEYISYSKEVHKIIGSAYILELEQKHLTLN